MKQMILLAALASLTIGCGPRSRCVVADSRCVGSVVQICNSRGEWVQTQDCVEVWVAGEQPWVCRPVPADELGEAGHACVPLTENDEED